MSGIYKITNIITKDFYIGSSLDIKRRWKDYRKKYKRLNKKSNSHILRAIIKYGIENFEFEILEEIIFGNWCEKKYKLELLLSVEQFYIITLNPSYNIVKDLSLPLFRNNISVNKGRIGFSSTSRPVEVFVNENKVAEFPSIKKTAEFYGFDREVVSIQCNKKVKNYKRIYHPYTFKYK